MKPAALLSAICLLVACSASAQPIGTVTFVEGSLELIRGTMVLQAGEGVRLQAGDIVESSGSGFVQLELTGGTIVAVGPSSRVMLLNPANHGGGRAAQSAATEVVLLSGWLKAETASNAGSYRYVMPLLGTATRDGTVVLHAGGEAAEIFVESGSVVMGEITPEGEWRGAADARAGQFFTRRAGRSISTWARPTPEFIDSVPRQFRDTLPHRAGRFAGTVVEPRRAHEVSYAEIQGWLRMPRAWRAGLVRQFEPRLHDPAFRKALAAHIRDHPEWDRLLHPESYEQKAPPANTSVNPPSGSR
jgi:hypothetical protein